jgi:hypothetical protein
LRAYVAKELTQSYGLKQTDVARLLGITQAAVSKYARHVRGAVLEVEKIDEVQVIVKKICVSLVNGDMPRKEVVRHFCAACRTIRQKRLMCELCKRSDPTIDISQCDICISKSSTCLP